MGGLAFPCFVMKPTVFNSFLLTLLFNFLTRFTFMLEESLMKLYHLIKPQDHEAADSDHDHLSTISPDSLTLQQVPTPVEEGETITLMKNSPPVVAYGDYIRRFQVLDGDHDQGDEYNYYDEDVICTVCLNYMEKSDEMRVLSNCSHVFHRECLDSWLNKDRLTCPLCRSTLYSS